MGHRKIVFNRRPRICHGCVLSFQLINRVQKTA